MWLKIANFILKGLEKIDYLLYTISDYFSFIYSGRRQVDLELEPASALETFCLALESLYRQLYTPKSKPLTFAKSRKFERKPTIRINGTSVHHVLSLQLLRIVIDQHLN